MNDKNKPEIDFELLSFIVDKNAKNTSFSQREIAKALKISLGMTNNILKKVLQKGFVLISKLDGKRLNYVLTPPGTKYIYDKSVKYFKNISKNAYQFKDTIFSKTESLKKQGYTDIVLLGSSGLDFVIEYCTIKNNMNFDHILNNQLYDFKKEKEEDNNNIDLTKHEFKSKEILKRLKQNNRQKTFYFVAEEAKNQNVSKTSSINLNDLVLESFINKSVK